MDEIELQAFRRTRLADWLKAHGGARSVCQRRGLKKSTESHISQLLSGATFGQKAARSMEAKLGMDKGYLDDMGQHAGPMPSPVAMELAWLFDDIVQGMGPRERSMVYQAAQEAITRPLSEPTARPSGAPVQAVNPGKQRV